MMAVCQIYAEVKLADLPVREGKEAREWLTSTHGEVECAREHISMRIRNAGERRELLYPSVRRYSHHQQRKRRARVAMFCRARGAGAVSCRQVQNAVDRVRLQASRTPEAATEPPGSEPGGVSFKGPQDGNEAAVTQRASAWGLSRAALRRVRRYAAIIVWMQGIVSPTSRVRPVQAVKKDKKTQVAGEAAKGAMKLSEGMGSNQREDSACPHALGRPEVGLVDTVSESDTSDAEGMAQLHRRSPAPDRHSLRRQQAALVPDKLPEGNSEFSRELSSTMSAIANLVVKASGRSVSNGGWLYFSGAHENYRLFRTKCRFFQETYYKVTPQKSLVDMFREWNLAEEVACHIKGAEDMSKAWRMLDAVYDDAPAQTNDQMPETVKMHEPQEAESEEGSEAEAVSERQLAPPQARGATTFRIVDAEVARSEAGAAIGPQERHAFIYTLHGIRRLKCFWMSGREPEHTVVSHEAAQRYSLRIDSRQQATWITGPTGVTVGLDTDYKMFLLMDDLPGCTKRIFAHGVKSVERFCSMASEAADEYEIQLRRDHAELLDQLRWEQPHRTGANLSEQWGETIRRLPVSAESGELVWINAIRSYRQKESKITQAACRRLSGDKPKKGPLCAIHVRTITGLAKRAPIQA
jgi:hypothetical protein